MRYLTTILVFLISSCGLDTKQPNQVGFTKEIIPVQESKLTLGLVQQIVKKGITEQKLIEGLGSPNMVTTNSDGETAWIYDAVSTNVTSSSNSSSVSILGGAGIGSAILGGGIGKGKNSSTVVRTQRTLTLIIKLKDGIVVSYATRATKF